MTTDHILGPAVRNRAGHHQVAGVPVPAAVVETRSETFVSGSPFDRIDVAEVRRSIWDGGARLKSKIYRGHGSAVGASH